MFFFQGIRKKKFFEIFKKMNSGFITQKLLNSYDIGILTTMIDKNLFKDKEFNNSYNVIGDFDYFINSSLSIE